MTLAIGQNRLYEMAGVAENLYLGQTISNESDTNKHRACDVQIANRKTWMSSTKVDIQIFCRAALFVLGSIYVLLR